MLTILFVVLAVAGIAAYVRIKKSGGLAELFDSPPGVHPTTGVGTTTAPQIKLPAGIIGAPNSDRLVQVQAVEDFRAKFGAPGMDSDAEPNNNWWARHLPHWWAIDEVARSYPSTDAAAAYVISQCNHKMLIGALNRNNSNEWVPWVNRPGSTETYASPLDAGVVAGPNNFGPLAATGFPGIKVADLPALLEANRKIVNSGGKRSDDDVRVSGPIHGGGTGPRSRG